MSDFVKKICVFCGCISKGKYCDYCSTKEKRREMIVKQMEINEENKKNGFNVPDLSYEGKSEMEILKEYKIKIS